jgi:1-deoxy-D-xylulose-5-phosphate reductoisomerase
MVAYHDGSVLAQLGNPDMRTPIAHALAWPERIDSGVADLNLFEVARLDFETADLDRFPCLRLAIEAIEAGGTTPAVLNAANEIAVEAFLNEEIAFTSISRVIEQSMAQIERRDADCLETIFEADAQTREVAMELVKVVH